MVVALVVALIIIVVVVTSFSTSSPNRKNEEEEEEDTVSFIGSYVQKNILNTRFALCCCVWCTVEIGDKAGVMFILLSHII